MARLQDNPMAMLLVLLAVFLLAACSDGSSDTTSDKALKNDAKPDVPGIDVSHYSGKVDWTTVGKQDLRFAYIKVSEGLTVTDSELSANWSGSHAAGLMRGGYHTFTKGDNGKDQAFHFLKTLRAAGGDIHGALPPALDVEPLRKADLTEVRQEIADWLSTIEAETGCRPVVYTSPAPWDETLAGGFGNYRLWLADYAPQVRLPRGWKKWQFWQYSDEGKIDGVEGYVDLDQFNGNRIELSLLTCVGW